MLKFLDFTVYYVFATGELPVMTISHDFYKVRDRAQ